MEKLDEKGFVFIDDNNKPYWCRMWGDEPWFMYWHEGQKSWVSLRKVSQQEIWFAHALKIPDDQAQVYHDQHEEFKKLIHS